MWVNVETSSYGEVLTACRSGQSRQKGSEQEEGSGLHVDCIDENIKLEYMKDLL